MPPAGTATPRVSRDSRLPGGGAAPAGCREPRPRAGPVVVPCEAPPTSSAPSAPSGTTRAYVSCVTERHISFLFLFFIYSTSAHCAHTCKVTGIHVAQCKKNSDSHSVVHFPFQKNRNGAETVDRAANPRLSARECRKVAISRQRSDMSPQDSCGCGKGKRGSAEGQHGRECISKMHV